MKSNIHGSNLEDLNKKKTILFPPNSIIASIQLYWKMESNLNFYFIFYYMATKGISKQQQDNMFLFFW